MQVAQGNQLNNSAIGVVVLGALLFIVGLVLFIGTISSANRSIDNMHRSIVGGPVGLLGGSQISTSSGGLGSTVIHSSSGSTVVPTRSSSTPNMAGGIIGVLLMGGGGFLVKVGIGMGLVANAKPIARWVGDVAGQGTSRYGAFRSGGTERPAEKIQVRCQHCRGLNNEGARFCSQCGKEI